MKKYSIHIIWAVIVVVALVGGIFYGKSSAASRRQGRSSRLDTRRFCLYGGRGFCLGSDHFRRREQHDGLAPNGNSQVVFYSSSTQVMKPTIVPASTLGAGTRVMIGGTANSDGSLTAQSIQVQTGSGFGGSGNASGTRRCSGSGQ